MIRTYLRRLAALLAALTVAACGSEGPSPTVAARTAKPGIVLIVVDTLRADAVPLSDAEPAHLPALRTFAKGATTFADAVASAAWTPQSMASVLTGLSPPHTGCQGTTETGVPGLPGGVRTLAERLAAEGYSTAAYTGGGWLADAQGIGQGFDPFHVGFDLLGVEVCLRMWTRQRRGGEPFFLLLHTYAPHDPYGEKDERAMASVAPSRVPPSPTLLRTLNRLTLTSDARIGPDEVRECAFEWFLDGPARPANSRLLLSEAGRPLALALQRWQDGGYLSDPAGRDGIEERLRAGYRQGLGLTDALLLRAFAALDEAALPPDTIVIVTSDHGEAHGENGYLFHERYLHDEIVRVPLLVRAPGRVPAGAVVRGTCGPVDLTPTVLELAGFPAPEGELDGRSLVAQAHGREGGHPVLSTADRHEPDRDRAVREITIRDERRLWSYTYDLLTGEVVAEHAFDLVEDPRAVDPRRVDTLDWPDPEFCRLLDDSRDEVRKQFGLLPLDAPCELPR